MNRTDFARLLRNRHIKIAIEWGGTDLFTNISNMSDEGVAALLGLLNKSEEKVHKGLSAIVDEEYSKETS